MGDNQLSFGLAIVMFQFKIDGSDFIFSDDQADPLMGQDMIQSFTNLDANFGVYFIGDNYFAGYSATQLFNSAAQFGVDGDARYKINRAHHFIAGYTFEVNNEISIRPNTLVQLPENMLTRLSFGVDGMYQKKFSVGLNYKTGSALSFHGEVIIDRYRVGYAFDHNFSDIMPGTYGSHEIFISAKLGKIY